MVEPIRKSTRAEREEWLKAAKNNVELRDPQANYNKMNIADLKALVPEINWDAYFEASISILTACL